MYVGLDYKHDAETLRAVAAQVAREAAELVSTMREHAVTEGSVDTKSSETDVVTAADRAAERLVREQLARLRPGEPVLGEEEGAGSGGSDGLAGLRWVVDPIDGTVNYLYGFPWYAVSVAAQLDGESLAGAVVEPASGRVWSAAKGGGATVDDRPLNVSNATRLELSLIGTGFAYSQQRRTAQARVASRLLSEVRDIRRAGAASLDLCAVAAGWIDAYYEHGLNRWDWAAGALIATEAGADVRLPGADHTNELTRTDELSDDLIVCATPGIRSDLEKALVAAGVDEI